MKIILASSSSGSRGGGELYLLYLGRGLRSRDHDVTLWASDHPRMDELCASFQAIGSVIRSQYRNTYDYRTRSLASHFNYAAASRVAREWRELSPACVHINKQNLEDGLDLLRAARRSGIPHLTTVHLTQTARYLRAQSPMLRDLVANRALRSDRGPLVCVLQDRADDLAHLLGDASRIHVIPNGVTLYELQSRASIRETQRSRLGISSEQLLFVAVGRLVPQKRPLLFLEIATRIHTHIRGSRFIWVGDGELATEWDEMVRSKRIESFVRRVGWQTTVRDFLFAADVFLHTAEFEGLPLAILEALSAALPCAITSNLLAEMPFLTPNNSIAIGDGEAWMAVLRDTSRLREMGVQARRLAEEQFSYERMAKRYEALYQEITDP